MTRETPDFGSLSGNPLSVIRNPSGAYTVRAGSSFELRVTISNQGNLSAIINIFIDDEASQQVRQWCASPNERIALSPNSTSEVVFEFLVPPQTLPGNYTYRLIVDAPEHYPEHTPIRCLQPLQVLPAIESAVQVGDPTFTVSPASSSTESITLQPGQLLQVSVLVDNRSNRVDRFWLTCPDLEESWFAIRYPEGLQVSGVVTTADGLDLNPGVQGEILLFVNPPLNALAGNYCATLRLQSANDPDWVLLDAMYLQILPVYLINVELRTILGKVRRLAGLFEVRLTNEGNTLRGIIVRIRSLEEEELCSYTLEPSVVWILPKATANAALQVKPTKWWRRPLYGTGLPINFAVELEDPQQLPLPNELPQGTLVWEARPWWQLLLLLLTGLCTLGAIAFLIWWRFFGPPASPKIIEFASDNTVYQRASDDFVSLNWKISNPEKIQSLLITAAPSKGAAVQPISYDFSKGIPSQLKNFCNMNKRLVCKNIRTEARQAGNYVFELKVFSKGAEDVATDSSKTNLVTIQPFRPRLRQSPPPPEPPKPPKIKEFFSTKSIYQEASSLKTPTESRRQNSQVRCQPSIPNPSTGSQPSSINLSMRSQPSSINPSPGVQPSSINVSLGNQPSSINPAPEVQPSSINPSLGNQPSGVNPSPRDTILLNWTITNPKQLKQLKLIGRAPDGSVNSELKRFDFSKGIPNVLKNFCNLQEELTCKNVPTDARTPGDYVFEITADSNKESGENTISLKTDTIKIKPNIVPLKIVQLKVNDQAADTKYFIPLNSSKPIRFATISWQVEGGKDMKIELLPSPGKIPPVGCIIYPLSQQPSSQTLTLKGTDGAGQEISQSVTFETLNRREGDASTAVHFLRVKETAKNDTYFKTDWRRQAEDLNDDQKYRATLDKKYPIKTIKKFDNSEEKDSQTQEQLRDYWFVEFENKYKGKREWYIYKLNFEEVKCCTLNPQ